MRKKNKRNRGAKTGSEEKSPPGQNQTFNIPKQLKQAACTVLSIIAFLLYSNTLNHGYVLDDFQIIKDNSVTKRGVSALGRIFSTTYRAGSDVDEGRLYRPLSKAMFAIEWQLAPDNPHLSHWVNVLLYALTAAMLFLTLVHYLRVNVVIPFVITLLYIAHPIHTEVVANIKGRDEMLSLLFILASLIAVHRHIEKGDKRWMYLSFAAFFLALLSKESAITYLAVVPVTLWFLTDADKKTNLRITAGMCVTTAIYLMLHFSVVGTIGVTSISVLDNSFLATADPAKQKATAIVILGHYLKLLIFPHPLSSDYSYNTIPIVDMIDPTFLLAFLVHAGLAVYVFLKWKAKDLFAWCILIYFITMSLASNIFYLIGTNMAERLLYLPSLAFAVASGLLLAKVMKTNSAANYSGFAAMVRANSSLLGVAMICVLAYSCKTWDRNKDWETALTLYNRDLQTVPNSAHLLFNYGNRLATESFKNINPREKEVALHTALEKLKRALEIYEPFADAYYGIGRIYYELKNYDLASKAYQRAIALASNRARYQNNYGACLFAMGRYEEAKELFVRAVELDNAYTEALYNLGSVHGALGEIAKNQGKTQEANALFEKAVHHFKEAARVDPEYDQAYVLIVATYNNLGRPEDAKPYQIALNELREKKKGK